MSALALQVYKVVFVAKITNLTDVPHIARELMMVKVHSGSMPFPSLNASI